MGHIGVRPSPWDLGKQCDGGQERQITLPCWIGVHRGFLSCSLAQKAEIQIWLIRTSIVLFSQASPSSGLGTLPNLSPLIPYPVPFSLSAEAHYL